MRVIGQLVCGPGEADRYLRATLKELKRLCDDVIVCLCNAGPKEAAMVAEFDFRAYSDDREWGRWQWAIKQDLLARIRLLNPDWVIALDADETMPTLTRASFEKLAEDRRAMQFFVVNLWNDPDSYAPELSFWNVRAYNPNAFSEADSLFIHKAVHCGNAPSVFYALAPKETYVAQVLLHKGLMEEATRRKKSTRYAQYDPYAVHKGRDYYDALGGVARVIMKPYDQGAVAEQIIKFVNTL